MRAASYVAMGATNKGRWRRSELRRELGATQQEGLCEKFNELRELHIKKGAVKILTIEGSYV